MRQAPEPEKLPNETTLEDVNQLGLWAALGSLGYVFRVVYGMAMIGHPLFQRPSKKQLISSKKARTRYRIRAHLYPPLVALSKRLKAVRFPPGTLTASLACARLRRILQFLSASSIIKFEKIHVAGSYRLSSARRTEISG